MERVENTENLFGRYFVNFKNPIPGSDNDPLPATVAPHRDHLFIVWDNGKECAIDAKHVNIFRKKETMNIKVEISEEQLETVNKALDLYSRVLCGQTEEVQRVIERTDFGKSYTKDQRNQAWIATDMLKRSLFSETYPASFGITSEGKLAEQAALAYDILQVIKKFLDTTSLRKATNKLSGIFKTSKKDLAIISQ